MSEKVIRDFQKNRELWDSLKVTDPDQTSGFKRAGGFSGTAIKPIYIVQKMTEHFGPIGQGWGTTEPKFEVVHGQNGEVLCFCWVGVWHGKPENLYHGVGGDKVIAERGSQGNKYLFANDEAFKMAFTDAVNNALKYLGVGADIHMGLFDDNKYITQAREVTARAAVPPELQPKVDDFEAGVTSAKTVEELSKILDANLEMIDKLKAHSAGEVTRLQAHYSRKKKELQNA